METGCISVDTILDNKDRAIKCLCAILSIVILFCACDPNSGHRPHNYPNSVWVCESPYIYISVAENGTMQTTVGAGEDTLEVDLCFDYGSGVVGLPAGERMVSNETILFEGTCSFHRNMFTVSISRDNLWNGKYQVLKFKRIE